MDNLHDLPDGEKILEFFVPGRPATKKTSQRIVKRGKFIRILPSLIYERYEKYCKETMEEAWKNLGNDPIPCGVAIKLTITLDNYRMGDEVGYYQAIGDILEKYGVIANDQLIHWTDRGERVVMDPDKENAGVKIEIYRYRHPLESRANFKDRYENTEDQKVKVKPRTAKTNKRKPSTRKKT